MPAETFMEWLMFQCMVSSNSTERDVRILVDDPVSLQELVIDVHISVLECIMSAR